MKKILKTILGVFLACLAWAVLTLIITVQGWLHTPIADGTIGSYSSAIDREVKKEFVGNLAVATLRDGAIELEKFYSANKPVDRNTVFQVASLSKWITAFGVMHLVESGKVDLDSPISIYLTRWQLSQGPFNNDEVTVRRLLSHTAGLTDGLGYSGFESIEDVQTIEQSLTKAADADSGKSGMVAIGIKPGSRFEYSGGGYTLLQLLIEEVSGLSFEAYMQQTVFKPLQMEHSTFHWFDSSQYQLAEFYNQDSTHAKHYHYTALAATSLYTSLSDLELFVQTHLPGKQGEPVGRNALKPETVSLMRKPHAQQFGVDIWGLGTILFAPTNTNDFIIGHDGKSTPPINTAIRLNPETGDAIIVLETGHPILATRLASEWVFWRTGQVDSMLFAMQMDNMILTIAMGWIVILIGSLAIILTKRN
jgi:CubicO group peptidase (beta-lactamase class C family)